MTSTPAEFETLCDKQFELARREAFDGLDREVAGIRNKAAAAGSLQNSGTAQMILDATLARYDKVIAAFDRFYLGKWRETERALSDEDCTWLKSRLGEKLDPVILDVRARCNSLLYEPTLTFAPFWDKAELTARERRNAVLETIEILRLQKKQPSGKAAAAPAVPNQIPFAPWDLLHPIIEKTAHTRYDSGHYADAVEAAFKEVNDIVRKIVRERTGKEFDGADLMNRAFSMDNPVIILDDLGAMTGRNIQVGYMQIFAGSMTGIRNPKAHANIRIDPARALHFLFLASLLLFKIDERAR
jgi:uncharacterized protein (TIGR02391 family)